MKIQKIEKPSADCSREGTGNNLDGNSKDLSVFDNTGILQNLQSNLFSVINLPKKKVKLYRCFDYSKNFALPKISSCLLLYRTYPAGGRGKVKTAKNNFTEKTLNRIPSFLRRQFV